MSVFDYALVQFASLGAAAPVLLQMITVVKAASCMDAGFFNNIGDIFG